MCNGKGKVALRILLLLCHGGFSDYMLTRESQNLSVAVPYIVTRFSDYMLTREPKRDMYIDLRIRTLH